MIERTFPTLPADYTPAIVAKVNARYFHGWHNAGRRGFSVISPTGAVISSQEWGFHEVIRTASNIDGLAEKCTVVVSRSIYGDYVPSVTARYTGRHARRVIDAIRALYLTPQQRAFCRVVVQAGIAPARKAMQVVERDNDTLRDWLAQLQPEAVPA
jgi:hypothetical protein